MLLCLLLCHVCAKGEGIVFYQGTFDEALRQARSENKLLFIDVYTSWCGPCKILDKNVFTDPEVGKFYNRHFIPFQIDAEKGEGKEIARRLNINCYPTLIYLDSEQVIKHRFSGVVSCEEFIQRGKTAMDDRSNLAAFEKAYKQGEREPAFLIQYIKLMEKANLDYKQVTDEYWQTVNPEKVLVTHGVEFLCNYLKTMSNPVFSYFLDHLQELEKKSPGLIPELLEQCIRGSISGVLQKKDYKTYEKYIQQLSGYSWKEKEEVLLWAKKEYYKNKEDWDNYIKYSIIYLDTYAAKSWVETWRFIGEFLPDNRLPFRADIAIPYAARAVKLMPNYSTFLDYAKILYKTKNPAYKQEILDLTEKAIQYEKEHKTGRNVTPEQEFMKKVESMDYDYNCLSPFVITIQPVIVCNDLGEHPVPAALPREMVERVYEKANIDFYFLPPVYWNSSNIRDGKINLDSICRQATQENIFKGQKDIVNMVFVNRIDGQAGPQGRGLQNGNVIFITLGDNADTQNDTELQTFVVAHELGHNLGLAHTAEDKNIADTLPNIMGDGAFSERIDPFYSLIPYQLNIIHRSPLVRKRIDFLSRKDGQVSILDETFEPYFSRLQAKEIIAFTGKKDMPASLDEAREELRRIFRESVMEFTPEERVLLTRVTNKVIFTLQSNGLSFMAEHPWRFIKVKENLCGGFAHTRGNCIVLSEKHLQFLTENGKDLALLTNRIGQLIVHEQTHILQRIFPDKFRRLNTEYWNFVQAALPSTADMITCQVSNPDAISPGWLIRDNNGKYYWPRVLFDEKADFPEMGKDFVEYAYPATLRKGKFHLKPQNRILLSELTDYKAAFPVTTGIDHPYEIAAYMLGDYFTALLNCQVPFRDISPEAVRNTCQFMKWCKNEMSGDSIQGKATFWISQMTLKDKIEMISGDRSFFIRGMPELRIPPVGMTDGPQGIKGHGEATAFPSPICLAATWNTDLAYTTGQAIAKEGKAKRIGILLAPGVNMYRVPQCGRNFEYMGEDPYLASRMAVAYIRGVQDNGMLATIKHFAANNQDFDRHTYSSDIDQRTLHEIYFPPFKAAVQEAGVGAVMTSYNLLNGVHTSESDYLINNVLKKEWGFKGIVMSDWIAVYSPQAAIAGLDLEMPSGQYMNAKQLFPLILNGQLPIPVIEDKVRRIMETCIRHGLYTPASDILPDLTQHDSLATRIAEEGIVLLKNNNILPLKAGTIKVYTPTVLPYSGGGATHVTPNTPPELFRQLKSMEHGTLRFTHSDISGGYDTTALQGVGKEDIILIVAGFNPETEGEAFDRPFALPSEQDLFIRKACRKTPNVIVIIMAGGGVFMPWLDGTGALLHSWYPGQSGDKALAQLLLGQACPSGKLPISIEKKWQDNAAAATYDTTYAIPGAKPFYTLYGKSHEIKHMPYSEGIFTGYRHYEHQHIEPLFPFGFGLSYTSFKYSQGKADKRAIRKGEQITFYVTVENKGHYESMETIQLYIRDMESSLPHPEKELKGFQKIRLKPGEKKQVSFTIDEQALCFYDDARGAWTSESGKFSAMLGTSSADIRCRVGFELK